MKKLDHFIDFDGITMCAVYTHKRNAPTSNTTAKRFDPCAMLG